MKKITILSSFVCATGLLFLSASASAKEVPAASAKKAAENFFQKRSANTVNSELSYTAYDEQGHALYYAFSMNNNSGFVIISADDAASPVIGYSTEEDFKKPDTRSTAFAWLSKREAELKQIKQYNYTASAAITAKWNSYLTPKAQTAARSAAATSNVLVGPLLLTKWNQSPFYNDSCPGNSVTGCVATTMAQIMKYWNYPSQGTGASSYCDCVSSGFSNTFGTLKANYNTTYNWNNMPLTISTHNPDIAKIMYHCGVSVQMNYDPTGSSAAVINLDSPTSAENSYISYFKYDPTTISGVYRATYSDNDWLSMLKNDLDIGRPVQYAGFGPQGGHTWVCDGYDDNDFFHMNWGWGGSFNGYFMVDNLNPGTNDFSNWQQALFGIVPMGSAGNDAGVLSVSAIDDCTDLQYTPVVKIRNYSVLPLNSCTINYQLDNGTVQNVPWSGSLVTGQTDNVYLPAHTLTAGLHSLTYYISSPNGGTDINTANDQQVYQFAVYSNDNLPVVEGFETPAQTDLHWQALASQGSDWTYTGQSASGGVKSIMINNLSNTPGNTSILQGINNYDFSMVVNPMFKFKVAYQQKTATSNDKLMLQTSNDCGKSWFTKWYKQGAGLASTTAISATPYIPAASEYIEYSVPGVLTRNTTFRWLFVADANAPGNNVYLDDINLGGLIATGIQTNNADVNELAIYPNPGNGETFLRFNPTSETAVEIVVSDLTGRTIITVPQTQYSAGEQVVSINKDKTLSQGIYLVTLSSNGVKSSRKLVID